MHLFNGKYPHRRTQKIAVCLRLKAIGIANVFTVSVIWVVLVNISYEVIGVKCSLNQKLKVC